MHTPATKRHCALAKHTAWALVDDQRQLRWCHCKGTFEYLARCQRTTKFPGLFSLPASELGVPFCLPASRR